LERIVSLIGQAELSTEDQIAYKRALMLKNYMTQNFTVVETQTEKKGVYVPVNETVADIKAILNGDVDKLAPEDLLYIATLKDVKDKIQTQTLTKPQDTQAANNVPINNPQQQNNSSTTQKNTVTESIDINNN
jgi:F0F1-type ATP synthase beta subunit